MALALASIIMQQQESTHAFVTIRTEQIIIQRNQSTIVTKRRESTHLTLSENSNNNSENSSTKQRTLLGKQQGVYSRPSAAIERGSGFFFPGLEGPKVRLVFGTVLMALTVYNHVASSFAGSGRGDTFSEGLAVVYSLLVLLQGAVELRKEGLKQGVAIGGEKGREGSATATGKVKSYQQVWSIPVDDDEWRQRVEWAASSYLSLTPSARNMMLIGPGKIVYSLGMSEQRESNAEACQAALDTLAKSTSGRVALPATHPAVKQLVDAKYKRCVVLQRVDDNLCWLMSSDQLLAGFSQQDLQWLGQLGKYVDPRRK